MNFPRFHCPFVGCSFTAEIKNSTSVHSVDEARMKVQRHRHDRHRNARSLVDGDRQAHWEHGE